MLNDISFHGNPSQSYGTVRGVTCQLPLFMRSLSVVFDPTQVNTSRLNPSQTGQYSIYLPRRDGRL